jgi:hypothetical protein
LGLVLLGSVTANSQTSLVINSSILSTNFASYLIMCDNFETSGSAGLLMYPSINNGSSYPTLSLVYYTQRNINYAGTTATEAVAATFTGASVPMLASTSAARSNRPCNFEAKLRGFGRSGAGGTKVFSVRAFEYYSGAIQTIEFDGTILDASMAGAPVNAVEFALTDSTAFSGTFNVYGYAGI